MNFKGLKERVEKYISLILIMSQAIQSLHEVRYLYVCITYIQVMYVLH